jgi:hypothetical protein
MVDGYWGKPTANYDWCEDNYVLTPYVAEFWNALSSLPTLTVGLYFLLKARKHAYGYRFEVAGAMLAIVGLGSAAFHGTLTRWGQILDEVPMLYSSSVFLWIAGSLDARGRDAAGHQTERSTRRGAHPVVHGDHRGVSERWVRAVLHRVRRHRRGGGGDVREGRAGIPGTRGGEEVLLLGVRCVDYAASIRVSMFPDSTTATPSIHSNAP